MGWYEGPSAGSIQRAAEELGDALDWGAERLGKGAKKVGGLFSRGTPYGPDERPETDASGWESDTRDDERDRAQHSGWNARDVEERNDRGWGRSDDGRDDRGWSRNRDDAGGWGQQDSGGWH